jgi:hypothetical protein
VKIPYIDLQLINTASIAGSIACTTFSLASNALLASTDIVTVLNDPVQIVVAGRSMLIELPAPSSSANAIAKSGSVHMEIGLGNFEKCRKSENRGSNELHFEWELMSNRLRKGLV